MSPGPSNSSYSNWGTYNGLFNSQPGLDIKEPNAYDYPPEYCGAADYFEAITLPGGAPWGWNDQNCILRYAFICKFWPRERAGPVAALLDWLWHCWRMSDGGLSALQGLADCCCIRGRPEPDSACCAAVVASVPQLSTADHQQLPFGR